MRIPYPERVPLDRVAIFAVVLFLIQILEGTALYFSMGCAAFLLLAAVAFNTAGGLTRASGAYVFFYSVLVFIIGVSYKAFLGEPADSNLLDPVTTIAVYVGGMAAMTAAVILSRRLSRSAGLLQNVLSESLMYRACVGCIVFSFAGPVMISLLGNSGARIGSAFNQLNQLLPLAIIIGVMYEIRRSGGARSINLPVIVAAVYYFLAFGLLGYSKQGMLLPLYCWLVPVCALRFRLSAMQIISCLVGVLIIFYYLVPYAQYGRRFLSDNAGIVEKTDISIKLLEHPEQTRKSYTEVETGTGSEFHYYNSSQGFWDRLQFISTDDTLINITDRGRVFGLSPIKASFLNVIPHVFWPNKPSLHFGNLYAHEIGELPADDTTTGISFSPTAEAYHLDTWVGVLVVAPLIWLLLFVVLDSLFGDLRATPWGLLVLAFISHYAPEGGITGAIYVLTYGTAIFAFCAIFAAWVAPLFAIAVLGRDRRKNLFRPSPAATRVTPSRNRAPVITGDGRMILSSTLKSNASPSPRGMEVWNDRDT